MDNDSFLQLVLRSKLWPSPQSRNFAELSDPIIFAEVLEITYEEGSVSLPKLTSEDEGLRKRLRHLWVVEKPTRTTINGVLSAMEKFGWLTDNQHGLFQLTKDGLEMLSISKNEKHFRRKLAEQMHKRFIVPGWLISRLYALNPNGQGEIILPTLPTDWQSSWGPGMGANWSDEWSRQLITSADRIRSLFPGSFPIGNEEWIDLVQASWKRLATTKPSTPLKEAKNTEGQATIRPYGKWLTPRARLAQAMREAAIQYLFSSYSPVFYNAPTVQVADFSSIKHPIPPRAFSAWCPRLDALEFIFYTDFHSQISGRLLFPCGIFREKAPTPPFERVFKISDPQGRNLYLHQPTWDDIHDQFINTTLDTYKRISKKVGAIYISLLDVRDEVCRQLRLSSILFDDLLETAYRESIQESKTLKNITISLESDIREEQRSGHGLLRRPVYISKVPHSLIAISLKKRH